LDHEISPRLTYLQHCNLARFNGPQASFSQLSTPTIGLTTALSIALLEDLSIQSRDVVQDFVDESQSSDDIASLPSREDDTHETFSLDSIPIPASMDSLNLDYDIDEILDERCQPNFYPARVDSWSVNPVWPSWPVDYNGLDEARGLREEEVEVNGPWPEYYYWQSHDQAIPVENGQDHPEYDSGEEAEQAAREAYYEEEDRIEEEAMAAYHRLQSESYEEDIRRLEDRFNPRYPYFPPGAL
jgi:hypothetical protein